MGAGIGYRHKFFMLYDEYKFQRLETPPETLLEEAEEARKEVEEDDDLDGVHAKVFGKTEAQIYEMADRGELPTEWDDDAWDEFKTLIANKMDGNEVERHNLDHYHLGQNAYIFAENDRFYVGNDSSGGGPCIFAVPKVYEKRNGDEVEYEVGREVAKLFNTLLDQYRYLDFAVATSGYTSVGIDQYSPSGSYRPKLTAGEGYGPYLEPGKDYLLVSDRETLKGKVLRRVGKGTNFMFRVEGKKRPVKLDAKNFLRAERIKAESKELAAV